MSGSLSRIRLYAGTLTCARTDGVGVSSRGRELLDSDSILKAPWLAHLGVHRPCRRAPSLPSSYMGLAVLLLFWLFLSSPPACVYSAARFGCERVGVL